MPGGGIIQSRCISCGRCLNTCPGEVYSMNMGSITIKEVIKEGISEGIEDGVGEGMTIPIKLRLSDRRRAEEMCEILKEMIEDGEFTLTEN